MEASRNRLGAARRFLSISCSFRILENRRYEINWLILITIKISNYLINI